MSNLKHQPSQATYNAGVGALKLEALIASGALVIHFCQPHDIEFVTPDFGAGCESDEPLLGILENVKLPDDPIFADGKTVGQIMDELQRSAEFQGWLAE